MNSNKKHQGYKRTCLFRFVGGSLLIAVILLLSLKVATDQIVHRAEAKYPPANSVVVEGVRLNYVRQGSGLPVVIIGGRGGKVQDFTLSPLLPLLMAQYQVIALDRPGLGYSERPHSGIPDAAAQARLIHGALVELDLNKPILVGQSWGGAIALQYAIDYPGDLSGVVLLGAAPYPRERPPQDVFNRIVRIPVIGNLALQTVYVPIGHYFVAPALLKQSVDYFAPLTEVPPGYLDPSIDLGLRPSHIKFNAEEEDIINPSLTTLSGQLPNISVPVMIVAGNLDTYAFEQSENLDQDIPNSNVMIVEGANHFLWFSYPQVVVDAVQKTWDLAKQ